MAKKTIAQGARTPKSVAKKVTKKVVAKKAVTKRTVSATVYQIKITLRDVKPVVWRRILIESDKTMLDLYGVIIDSMGWSGYHLFAFRKPGMRGDIEIGIPGEGEWGTGGGVLPAWDEPVKKWLNAKSPKLILEYDFGDGWEHNVLLEKVLPRDAKAKYPQCIAGKRTCPPEDIGGPWAYMELLTALKDPHNPKYSDIMELFMGEVLDEGEDIRDHFDPDDFSPEDVVFSSFSEWLKLYR